MKCLWEILLSVVAGGDDHDCDEEKEYAIAHDHFLMAISVPTKHPREQFFLE